MNYPRTVTAAFIWLVAACCAAADPQVSLSVPNPMPSPSLSLLSLSDVEAVLVLTGDGGEKREVRIHLKEGRVVVGIGMSGPGPFVPPDPPDPDTPDPPEVPDGHMGLTRNTYDWVRETVDLGKDPDRDRHAKRMAENYVSVAAGLKTIPPKWPDMVRAGAELTRLNREVLPEGPVRDAWQVFAGRISPRLHEEAAPFSRAELAKRYEAVAAGLQAVAGG
jgi:hypothetical protein